ncbi:GntR family transcriptional regulator [Bradyrhizobium sp. STM 3561]|uniref:GntR family transcriptional regulator n=1 Tax=Bradyrhizobium sp. STM 3561 TaxID=578923 RepID=UPI00389100A1
MPTRWAIVAKLLEERIVSGEYALGSIIPTEMELAQQFDVSRSTIRAALRELQQAGMISRRRNAGTKVEAARRSLGPGSYNQTLASIEDVVQYAAKTERRVQEIENETVDEALASLLESSVGQIWLRVSSVRLSATKTAPPLCWTDVYVNAKFAPLVRERIHGYRGLISNLIEEFTGHQTSEIQQRMTATGVPKRIAKLLRAKPESHALEIVRIYRDVKGRAFIVSRSIHPADRFSYESRLRRPPATNGLRAMK